jgi:outer membrane protein assembly factor BamD
LFIASVSACATPPEVRNADTPAERLFEQGQHRMERGDYQGAIDKFDKVRNEHPYSRYSVRADLRVADAYFEQDQYASAREQYKTFVKLHPKHSRVAYARFRAGKAAFEQMPNNWFFLPPAHARDLHSTERAVQGLESFLAEHPDSKFADRGRKLLDRARRRLAKHELAVAKFYRDRNNPEGAAERLNHLLDNYPSLGLDAEALYLLAKSNVEMENPAGARAAVEDLIEYHPNSRYTQRARRFARQNGLNVGGS